MAPTYLETLSEHDRVAEEVGVLRLRQEQRALVRLEANAQTVALLEAGHDPWGTAGVSQGSQATAAGLGSAPNDLFHPNAIGFHSAHPGSRQHGCYPPYYRTEQGHSRIVQAARTIEAMCPTAVSVLEVLVQFAVYTGFKYTVTRKQKPGEEPLESDPERDAAQDWLDKWQKREKWHLWEKELFWRTRRDGEAFLVKEPTDEGGPHLRSTEPEQIKEPQDPRARNRDLGMPGGFSWRFGILTKRDDTAVPLGYWEVSQYSEGLNRGTFWEAEEMIHLKVNVDRAAKRGISDFFSGMNAFPRVMKLLRALTETATVQANIAWIKQHPLGNMPEEMGEKGMTTRTGEAATSINYNHPTCVGVPQGTTYTAGPLGLQSQDSALIMVLQAALRNIGARWQMPESLVSGDASNQGLAAELATAAPFTKAMECRQDLYAREYGEIQEGVLEQASMDGELGSADGKFLDTFEVAVEAPSVIPRNAKEETERYATLSDHGIVGNDSWSTLEGLKREKEKADIARDPIVQPMIGIMGPDEDGDGGEGDNPGNQETRELGAKP